MQKDQFLYQVTIPLYKRALHLNQIKQMSVYVTEKITFTLENDSAYDIIWREQVTRYYQLYVIERHNYKENRIIVQPGISLDDHTDLHVFCKGALYC